MRSKQVIRPLFLIMMLLTSCSKAIYTTNGESIYKSGKNLSGKSLLDKQNSPITIIKSCNGCHGSSGTRVRNCNIQWSHLTDANRMSFPYTKELFYRFMDEDLKSDGSRAITGVHWQMTKNEKDDLINYLNTLK
jgi:hypothetical protein